MIVSISLRSLEREWWRAGDSIFASYKLENDILIALEWLHFLEVRAVNMFVQHPSILPKQGSLLDCFNDLLKIWVTEAAKRSCGLCHQNISFKKIIFAQIAFKSCNLFHYKCLYLNFLFGSFRIGGEHLPLSGDQLTASGVTKTLNSQDPHKCKARYHLLYFCFLFFSKVFSSNVCEKWSYLCSIFVNNLLITQVICWLIPLYEG